MQTAIIQIFLAFILGALSVYYMVPALVKISKTKKLFDEPNHRRLNKVPVPNLGGVALFFGIFIGTMVGYQKNIFPDFRYLLICSMILLFIGLKDDLLMISARKKLMAQLVCAFVLVVLGDIRFTNLHGIIGLYEINDLLSYLISTLTIVAIINAINLIDGIDGLAASISLVAAAVLGVNFYLIGEVNFVIVCSAITGSLLIFFAYNVFSRSNKIFMGDTGALILGLLIAALIIKFNELAVLPEHIGLFRFSPVLTLCVIALPLFDMIRLFFIRLVKNKSPFSPDMNHIHHKFLKLGLSHRMVTGAITLFNLVLIATIYLLKPLNIHLLIIIVISWVTIFIYIPHLVNWFRKSKHITDQQIENKDIQFRYKPVSKPDQHTQEEKRKENIAPFQ